MRKTRGPPFPSRARLIFALLVLIRPHYAIREPGTGYTVPSSQTSQSMLR